MLHEEVRIKVPGILKYSHFISDAAELLFRERITFYADELMQRFLEDARVVLYEMFANAYYHSKSDFVEAVFRLEEEWIIMTFRTNNVGYGIKPVEEAPGYSKGEVYFPPYNAEFINQEIPVYKDAGTVVMCVPGSEYSAEFLNRREAKRELSFEEFPEHYGINLITRYSHETMYYRDAEGYDCFEVRRRIR